MKLFTFYDKDMCSHWVGVADGHRYKYFQVMHWMSVEDIVYCLDKYLEEFRESSS